MQKTAVFPGSFDPITRGHEDIIKRAAPLFDRIIVAIGTNSTKKYLFSLEQREQWLKEIFSGFPQIEITTYQGLTVDFCRRVGARYILRGLRNIADFTYENNIAHMNHAMDSSLETIFLLAAPGLEPVNATIVREIYINGGDISQFIPASISIPKILPGS